MAATNDPNEVNEALARVAEDMRRFGYVTDDTAKKLQDAKTGISNFAKKADQAADLTLKAFTSVAQAGFEAANAMADGAKGNQAFNSSLDKMREGVEATGALLTAIVPGGPIIKAFVAAMSLAAGKSIEMQKRLGKMSDDLFKGFQGLSKSGASAADGLIGMREDMKRLGLGIQDFETFNRLIASSGKDLAIFRGTVFEGRKQFAQIGQNMEQFNYQLRAMGMTQDDINEGTMSYLKIQSRVGLAQTQTTAQLAEGAKKYLVEQDALTKLTGQTRQEREQALQSARSQQAFRAKLDAMRASGDQRQINAAKELEVNYTMLYASSKEAAEGFGDTVTGQINSAAALKLFNTTMGQSLDITARMVDGQTKAVQGFEELGGAVDQGRKIFNQLYQNRVGEDFLLKIGEAGDLALSTANAQQRYEKALAELAKQTGEKQKGTTEDLLDANIRLAQEQQKAMLAMQDSFIPSLLGATEESIRLAKMSSSVSTVYDKLVPVMAQFFNLMLDLVEKILPPLIDLLKGLLDRYLVPMMQGSWVTIAKNLVEDLVKVAAGAIYAMVWPIAKLGEWIEEKLGGGLLGMLQSATGKSANTQPKNAEQQKQQNIEFGLNNLQGMAAGGPVNPNTPYIVGEKGPELFMPKNAGEIISTRQLLGSGQPAGMPEVDAEYRKITAAIRDITLDITERVKDNREISQQTEKLLEHNKKYTTSMISLLDQDLTNTSNYMESGGTPAAISNMLGQGLHMGGGMGMTGTASLAGLKLKTGDVHQAGEELSPRLVQLAQAIQSNMPNFNYFSAFNDRFHNEKAPSSAHTRGTALDFTLTKPPTPKEGEEIVRYLRSMGASLVIDEYNNPSSSATAGHIHAQIPGFGDGGIAVSPTIAMVAEKGPEAMMPLTSGGFLDNLQTTMSNLVPQQQAMIDLLEAIRRSQMTMADNTGKMVAMAA